MTERPKAPKVVVGIIDDGIAFAHERFRSGSKTRVRYVWLQDGVHREPSGNVRYGREIAKSDIDDLLRNCARDGAVNEDEVYLRAGLIDFRRRGHKAASWRIAHGTHVMDLACGFDSDRERDDVPIVCVQLPARTTANTSGAGLTPYAIDALLYIRDRADEIGGDEALPLVVNFSYGIIGGPHDGTSLLERVMDRLIAEREQTRGARMAIVLPAGNSHLSRCHAEVRFPAPAALEAELTNHDPNVAKLRWRIQPDDRTPSYLDIWLPPRATGQLGNRVTVTVTPPDGPESPPLGDSREGTLNWRPYEKILCSIHHSLAPKPTKRSRFRVTLRPTAEGDRPTALAPAGTWTVTLQNVTFGVNDKIHAWVQRDESLYGYPRRGRQSFFDDPRYERFDKAGRENEVDGNANCPVKREGLINAIATGKSTVVIGGFLRQEGVAAKYSSGGPTTPPVGSNVANREGPEAMAVSEESRVKGGVLAAGSRSGSVVAMGGTSVAAPQIARWIALRFAFNEIGDREKVKGEAIAQETNRPTGPPRPNPRRGGAGRITLDPIVTLPRDKDDEGEAAEIA